VLVLSNFAAVDVAQSNKGIMKGLVVDSIKVLDKDVVALASLTKGGVTLGPHDTAGTGAV
jgi:hypothetical protein